MNKRAFSNTRLRRVQILAMLCAGLFLIPAAPAQPTGSAINGRYLLIFDTSSAMKKRLPATAHAVDELFYSMMNGQLHRGDTIGVWTFSRKLRAGDFPLQQWLPQNAALIASNIVHFVKRQHYSRSTRFEAILPDINKLVRNSKRLTVLIFCDGEGAVKGTPFDDAINHTFKVNERALKKSKQAFVVVLRSQFGHYTGYTVNAAAIGVSFPDFPPLPAPPPPAPPPKTNPPPVKVESNPPPVVHLPPLVIVGTNVSTNLIPAITPKAPLSNPPPVKVESNPPPAATASNTTKVTLPPTKSFANPTNAVPPEIAGTHTNAPAAASEDTETPSGLSHGGALAIGGALLAAAAVLIVFQWIRSRQSQRGSLITRSMRKK